MKDNRKYYRDGSSTVSSSAQSATATFGVVLCGVAFFVFAALKMVDAAFITMLAEFICCFLLSVFQREKQSLLIIFYCMFFFFLLSHSFFSLFAGEGPGYNQFDDETRIHIALVLMISIVGVQLGFKCFNSRSSKYDQSIIRGITSREIATASKTLFYILVPFAIIVSLDKGLQVAAEGYEYLYIGYQSRLPDWFSQLSSISSVAFFVFLGTLPKKHECRAPIIIYMLAAILSLSSGQRNGFAVALVTVAAYYFIRHYFFPDGDLWVSRRLVWTTICLIPVIFLLFYSISFSRSGQSASTDLSNIQSFLSGQSENTSQLLGYGYVYHDELDRGVLYTISPIEGVVTQNNLVHKLFNTPTYTGYTVYRATEGYEYSHAIMYLINPRAYFNGNGLGSCYIAEAYQDFGYIGVVAVNLLYGLLFALAPWVFRKGPYWSGIYLMALQELFYAPRSIASGCIALVFTLTTALGLLLIALLSQLIRTRKHGLRLSRNHEMT